LIFGHGPLGLGLSAVPNSAPSKAVPHTAPHTGGTFTGGTFVSEVLEGSAAMAQGVVVGCLVLAVNGHDVRGDPPHEVQALIGQAVRPLTLTLSSPILSKTNPADAATAATAAATTATAAASRWTCRAR
jgi:C-terminal processing protease CtpA/Prc